MFLIFWTDLKIFILNSLNYGYRTGSLSITQKQGIITCLPKPNKSPFYLKNWRPISLLNVIYKLASSVIAARLKTVLHKLIHEDQKGFISGRFIGENKRQIYDILFETKQQQLPGLILLLIFNKHLIPFHGNLYTKHSNTLILDHPFNGGSNYFRLVLSHVYYKTVICQSFLDYKEAVDKETLSPHTFFSYVQRY